MFPTSTINQSAISAAAETDTAESSEKISFVFDFSQGEFNIIDGKPQQCTGDDALKVWIEKAIRTEYGRYKIYSDVEYGTVLEDLVIGMRYSKDFIESEMLREIETSLLRNDQIVGISNFSCSYASEATTVAFDVDTTSNGLISEEVALIG